MGSIAISGSGSGGGLFTLASNPPFGPNAPGTQFQVAFDAAGNLYICYATNTWARYLNSTPWVLNFGRFGVQGNVIYFRAGRAPPPLRIGAGGI